jgi:hypothetical protein
LYTPAEQPSPYPAEQRKLFVNDQRLQFSSKKIDQTQARSPTVAKIYEGKRSMNKYFTQLKFFAKISDHQQSVVPAPSRGIPHTPSSAGGR